MVIRLNKNGWRYCCKINGVPKKENNFCWLSELMKHRDAADSKRYRVLDVKFNAKYNERDTKARINMKALIDSDKNKVEKVFSTLV